MPFSRLKANLAGQVDTGGDGTTATLGGGLVSTNTVTLPKVSPIFGGDGITIDGRDAPAAVVDTSTGRDLVIVYRTQKDGRVRPSHAALEGQTWAIDDPNAPAPPLGYGCRCSVEIVDRSSVKRPPKSDAAALKKFPDLENNVENYMGKEIAALFKAGDIKPADLLRETGDPIQVTEARVIAAARKAGTPPAKGLQALAELNGMGIDDQRVRLFSAKAQALINGGATADDALRQVLSTEVRIGGLAARSKAVRDARIGKAIPRFKATGLLKYDPPPVDPVPVAPPKPTPPPKPVAPPPVPAHEEAAAKLAELGKRHEAELAPLADAARNARKDANDTYLRAVSGQPSLLMDAVAKHKAAEAAEAVVEARAKAQLVEARAVLAVPEAERTGFAADIAPARKGKPEIKEGIEVFRTLVSEKAFPSTRKASVIASKASRAFARPTADEVYLPATTRPSIVAHELAHELGHLLERDPAIKAASQAFLKRRTEGKPLQQIPHHKKDERYRDGGFRVPYVGKEYSSGFTEVLSMGLEWMTSDPIGFAKDDPDHFRFVFEITRGRIPT